MKYEITERKDAVVVAFTGDVDLESSPQARAVLLKCVDRSPRVLVDLSAVTYIDSSGVASLVESLQRARKGKCVFALAAASEATRRVLELARLDKVFTIYDTVESGLAKAN